jgi:hypothetical protein
VMKRKRETMERAAPWCVLKWRYQPVRRIIMVVSPQETQAVVAWWAEHSFQPCPVEWCLLPHKGHLLSCLWTNSQAKACLTLSKGKINPKTWGQVIDLQHDLSLPSKKGNPNLPSQVCRTAIKEKYPKSFFWIQLVW